jgi:ABC-2 type transport system permease protein
MRTPFAAVLRLELRLHAREPLSWLYLLVFTVLSAAFVGSNTVQLVPASLRGAATATDPWILALAMSGLSAFGQVITSMISVTTQLRDRSMRVDELVLAAPVPTSQLVAARLCAVVMAMGVVTLGMPIGALLGAFRSPDAFGAVVATVSIAWIVLVMPSVLLVTGLHAMIAAWRPTLFSLLGGSLLLVVLWQATTSPSVVGMLGTWTQWFDPFGGAALLAQPARDVARAATVAPWDAGLLSARAMIASLGIALAVIAVRITPRRAVVRVAPKVERTAPVQPLAGVAPSGATRAGARHVVLATALLWLRSAARERAFVLIGLLGALNVLVNVWAHPDVATTRAVFALATEHGRLILILLATIYAGELLWRARDLRVDMFLDASPASAEARALGGVLGLLLVEGIVSLLFAAAALGPAAIRGTLTTDLLFGAGRWLVVGCWIPLGVLTLLSLAVHVHIRHKVVAHLLLITAWIVAVTLDAQGVRASWARLGFDLAHAPAVTGVEPLPAITVVHWCVTGAAALVISLARWPRGTTWQPPPWTAMRLCVTIGATAAVTWTGWLVSR